MRKTSLVMAAFVLLASCGNNQSKPAASTNSTAATTEIKLTPEQEKGETLIAQSDCLGCHKIEDKLNGPAYREVAQKYAGQGGAIADTLARHIIKGHVGTWGNIPMTAHPALSEADAKAMVAYILTLKN